MNPNEVVKPNVTEEGAKDLLFNLYRLKVTSIKQMISFDDQNYHVKVSEDHENPYITNIYKDGYTLKITNTAKSALRNHFDSMHLAMTYLNKKGLRVPLPVPNVDGRTWKLQQVPLQNKDKKDGELDLPCGIHLLTFLPGVPVSTISYTSDMLYQWGVLLAQFHIAAEDFSCPEMKEKTIFWDLDHVPDIKPFTEVLTGERKTLILRVLEQYPEQIKNNIDVLPKGFIHGDFNENNILVQLKNRETSRYSVDGILDFEDMHFGTYVWDVGVMLAYTLLDCKTMDPLEGAGHALAGYLNHRQLSNLELSLIKICICCRLSQSLVLSTYSYSLDPGNDYLLSSSKTGWDRLEQIWNTDNQHLLSIWGEIQKLNTLS